MIPNADPSIYNSRNSPNLSITKQEPPVVGQKTRSPCRFGLEQSYRIGNSCVGTDFRRFGSLADALVGDGAVICPLHERISDLVSGKGKNAGCRIESIPSV